MVASQQHLNPIRTVKPESIHLNLVAALLSTVALLSACGGGQNGNATAEAKSAADELKSSALAVASTSTSSWVQCAREGGACVFSGTRTVRYGTSTKYTTKTFTESAGCNNLVFGDPVPGVSKQCWYSSATVAQTPTASSTTTIPASTTTSTSTTTTWAVCGYEGGDCSFSGTRQVRYGTVAQNVTRSFTNGVACSNSSFGDPAYGLAKTCWVASTVVATATMPASTTPTGTSSTTVVGATPVSTTTESSGSTGASSGSSGTSAPASNVTTSSTGIPTLAGIAGKTVVGRIVATSGQVIENVHVTTDNGACIVVPSGVTNVTIRNSEIGPCGTGSNTVNNEGVQILPGASNITVQRNVIHDVSAGVYANGANHPLVIDRNVFYNIRGPVWQGNIVQFAGVRGGTGQSKITCNVKDGRLGVPYAITESNNWHIGDHISMYNVLGSSQYPVEIAYNRIRGEYSRGYEGGSGMQLADGVNGSANPESGWYFVHHNTVVQTNGVGISVAGGHDIRVEDNVVDNRGENLAVYTGWSFAIKNFTTNQNCYNHSFRNNRSTIARLWAFNHDGTAGQGIFDGGGCAFTDSSNNHNDSALTSASPDQTFNTPYSQCN